MLVPAVHLKCDNETRSHLFLKIYFDCNAEIYPAKRVFLYLFAKLYLQPALVTEIVEIEEKMFGKAPLNLSGLDG